MSLHSERFDPDPLLNGLTEDLYYIVGKPVMRIAGPELKHFIHLSVRKALHDAFRQAESAYVGDMIKMADESSKTLIEGVFAGAKLADKYKEG